MPPVTNQVTALQLPWIENGENLENASLGIDRRFHL